jgi:hypothetical protein
MGNNPATDGYYMPLPTAVAGLTESERDKVLGDEAKRYITAKPGAFVLRSIKKAILLHVGETISVHWNAEGIKQRFGEGALLPLKLLNQGFWTTMLLLGLVGLMIMIRTCGFVATLVHPIILTWIYFTMTYAVTVIQDRYHFPSHPLIAILAATAILTLVRRTHSVRSSQEA